MVGLATPDDAAVIFPPPPGFVTVGGGRGEQGWGLGCSCSSCSTCREWIFPGPVVPDCIALVILQCTYCCNVHRRHACRCTPLTSSAPWWTTPTPLAWWPPTTRWGTATPWVRRHSHLACPDAHSACLPLPLTHVTASHSSTRARLPPLAHLRSLPLVHPRCRRAAGGGAGYCGGALCGRGQGGGGPLPGWTPFPVSVSL